MTIRCKIILFFLVALFSVAVFAQEAETAAAAVPDVEKSSEYDQRKEKIYYGVESEITDLIDTLIKDEDYEYSSELLEVFGTTRSSPLKEKIIDYFIAAKDPCLKEYALLVLSDPFEETKSIVNKVFSYISVLKITEAGEPVKKILKDENEEYQEQAATAIGNVGSKEDSAFLSELLDKKLPAAVKLALVTSLGKLKEPGSWKTMLDIAKDKDEPLSMRMAAVEALGSLETEEPVNDLILLYQDTDANFRSSVIKGLSFHSSESVQKVLIEAIKDNYFRVRLEAIKAVSSQKIEAAVKPLIYRAKNDSEVVVKQKTYEALGEIGTQECVDFLILLVKDTKQNETVRSKAAASLLKYCFYASIEDIKRVAVDTLHDDKQKKLRYALGKEMARYESPALEDICFAYLASKDVSTKGTGLDMYAKNAFPAVKPVIEGISVTDEDGANKKKAQYILDKLARQSESIE